MGKVTPTFVQVAPDSTGKKITNLLVKQMAEDGTISDVYIQAVALVDHEGNVVDFNQGTAAIVDAVAKLTDRVELLLHALTE